MTPEERIIRAAALEEAAKMFDAKAEEARELFDKYVKLNDVASIAYSSEFRSYSRAAAIIRAYAYLKEYST